MLIAHEENGIVYIVTAATAPGVTYPGAGTEQFATLDDVKARWPNATEYRQDDQAAP